MSQAWGHHLLKQDQAQLLAELVSTFAIIELIGLLFKARLGGQSRACSESLAKPFHDVGDMHKAQKSDVEHVKAGRYAAKGLHALEKVFRPDGAPCNGAAPKHAAFCG